MLQASCVELTYLRIASSIWVTWYELCCNLPLLILRHTLLSVLSNLCLCLQETKTLECVEKNVANVQSLIFDSGKAKQPTGSLSAADVAANASTEPEEDPGPPPPDVQRKGEVIWMSLASTHQLLQCQGSGSQQAAQGNARHRSYLCMCHVCIDCGNRPHGTVVELHAIWIQTCDIV